MPYVYCNIWLLDATFPPDITNLKARITDTFATIAEDMLGEHVERN